MGSTTAVEKATISTNSNPPNGDSINKPAVPEVVQWNGHKVTWFNKVVLFFKNHGASLLLAINGVAMLVMGLFSIIGVAGLTGVAGLINISAMGNAFGNVAAMGGGVVITFLGYTKFRGKPTESLEIEDPPKPAKPVHLLPSKTPGPATVGTSMGVSQPAPTPADRGPTRSAPPRPADPAQPASRPTRPAKVVPHYPVVRLDSEPPADATSTKKKDETEDERVTKYYVNAPPAIQVDTGKGLLSREVPKALKHLRDRWFTLGRQRNMSKETIKVIKPAEGNEGESVSVEIPASLEPTIAQMNAAASTKTPGKKSTAKKTVKFHENVVDNSPHSRGEKPKHGTAYQKLVKTGAVGGYLDFANYPLEGISTEDLQGMQREISELIDTHVNNGRTAEPEQLRPVLERVKAELKKRNPSDNREPTLSESDLTELNEILKRTDISLDELNEIIKGFSESIRENEDTNIDLGPYREMLEMLKTKLRYAQLLDAHEKDLAELQHAKDDVTALIQEGEELLFSEDVPA